MDDIPEQLARRDRLRKYVAARKTPAECVRAMDLLQETSWRLLRQNPAGYAHFLRRNFKARAIQVRDADVS
ncbi:MAG TPA: hypothetical protein VFC78_02300 [Tepidisphaeraceae bacterium]|nr:hypothetical protein [Tepidisphaeraceae bacterium]